MLILPAIPVIALVALCHRVLHSYAPSNMLVARGRSSQRVLQSAIGLAAVAALLVSAAHALSIAIDQGAPGWLNMVVLVLLWDTIKIVALGVLMGVRILGAAAHRVVHPRVRGTKLAL